jgi:capsular exopolysaccharide synthesis family protein
MATELPREPQAGPLAQAQHYWHVILKWKWTAGGFLMLAVVAATVFSLLLPPVYTANGTVWIEEDTNILPFEEVQSFGAGSNLQSHVRLLRSRSLAAGVIEKMKLYENPDFAGKLKKGAESQDPADPAFRELLVQDFLKSLGVTAGDRSSLVDVSFSNRNPQLAADILNALFDGYVDMIVSKRYAASEQATESLNALIAELRARIEEKEKELNRYGSEKDILPLTAAEAPTVSRIGEINKRLTDATLDRVNKLNVYNQLKAAPLGEIPNAPEGSLIQRLREQYITLSRDYRSRLETVRPEFPAMQRLKSQLDAATEALQNETQNLIRNAYNDYQNALNNEQSLQRLLDAQKNEAYKANSNSVVYNSLRIELENQKALLESLSKRQSETDVSSRLKGLDALNVWIVDKADYPLRPASPNKRKNVMMAFLFGLAGGIGLALGLEFLNNTVKTSKDVTSAIGVPTLGTVPAFEAEVRSKGPIAEFGKIVSMLRGKGERKPAKSSRGRKDRSLQLTSPRWANGESTEGEIGIGKIELISAREPQAIQSESYRSIRTTLLVSSPPGRIKTMLFTSPLAREGKSSTVSNMAITLAEAHKRVVIVDSDLRRPKQRKIFGAKNGDGPGLSRFLSSNLDAAEIAKQTEIPNLHLITSGPLPANPIELLTSERMDSLVAYLKRNFDFILLDTPPLLAVSDALAMGPMADAIILVARGGQTPIQALKQAKQKLDAHKLKCLGVILNGVDLVEQDGYYAREYYSYSKSE